MKGNKTGALRISVAPQQAVRQTGEPPDGTSMIPKGGYRLSEKIMLRQ
jgi:hypothetical protein